jgi:molecular chaperone DnaJ
MFGGGFGRQKKQGPQRGGDLHYRLRLSFNDSIKGVATKINVNINETCSACSGSGAKAGTAPVTCTTCGGRGVTSQSQGIFSISHTCPRCLGKGTIIESPCPDCKGKGVKRVNKKITIKIPAGVENGSTIRFKGKGEAAPNAGIPGDLFITVEVDSHPVFHREGNDIYLNLPITITEAALGDKIDVPTLDGSLKLKVPSGTVSGKTFRLKGKGVYGRRGYGDMFVKVFIIPPQKINRHEKDLLKKLAETQGNPRDAIFNIVNKEAK